jgi:hypothetical protein
MIFTAISRQDPSDIVSWIDVADAGVLVDLKASQRQQNSIFCPVKSMYNIYLFCIYYIILYIK